jgi:hypothetical protein
MTELGPAGRNLIRAVGHADDPSEDDEERVRRALTTSLGVALLVGTTAGSAAASGSAAATGLASKTISIAQLFFWFGAGATGGVAVAVGATSWPDAQDANGAPIVSIGPSARHTVPPHSAPSSGGPSRPPNDAPEPLRRHHGNPVPSPTETSAPELPDTSVVRTSGEAIAAFPETPSAFSEEVRLLERAQRSLATGRCDESLRWLDEYGRRFPRGVLERESLAVRTLCLCELGRDAEARALLERVPAVLPESPHLRQLRASCADDSED